MRTFCIHFIACLTLLAFSFPTCTAQNSPRKQINIDNNWKFHFGNASDPDKRFQLQYCYYFFKIRRSLGNCDRSADSTIVPGEHLTFRMIGQLNCLLQMSKTRCECHGYKPVGGLFPETSIGWYRKHFNIASAIQGARFQIQFDGIFSDASIWVNGFYVGNNISGYIGASYDITDFINFDQENVLVVRVDATQYEGWFYEGAGIYRHVWLNQYDNMHIADGGCLFILM